jgi:ABC-type glycerol-3-phosphate transport system substrate-binding protein
MNTRKRTIAFVAVLLIGSLLAACSGTAAPAAVPTTAPQPAAPTTAPQAAAPTAVPQPTAPPPASAPPEQVTLSVMTNRIGEQASFLEDIAQKFE